MNKLTNTTPALVDIADLGHREIIARGTVADDGTIVIAGKGAPRIVVNGALAFPKTGKTTRKDQTTGAEISAGGLLGNSAYAIDGDHVIVVGAWEPTGEREQRERTNSAPVTATVDPTPHVAYADGVKVDQSAKCGAPTKSGRPCGKRAYMCTTPAHVAHRSALSTGQALMADTPAPAPAETPAPAGNGAALALMADALESMAAALRSMA